MDVASGDESTTTERVLTLLGPLQQRQLRTGPELADRLGVTPRTVRRDVERLRTPGYPVHASQGVGAATSSARRRIAAAASRRRGISGWYELDWDHVADVLARWEPPTGCDLHLDAVAPLESSTARLRDLLRR